MTTHEGTGAVVAARRRVGVIRNAAKNKGHRRKSQAPPQARVRQWRVLPETYHVPKFKGAESVCLGLGHAADHLCTYAEWRDRAAVEWLGQRLREAGGFAAMDVCWRILPPELQAFVKEIWVKEGER